MPCTTFGMEPTQKEKDTKEVCSHLNYVNRMFGTNMIYTTGGDSSLSLDYMVKELCKLLRAMTVEQQNRVIYDGRNPEARRLADWWDTHKENDRKREQAEALQDNNEWFANNLISTVTEELALAKKGNRAINTERIREWIEENG